MSFPVPAIDLSVKLFTLTTETLVAGASTGFQLTASVALTNGMTLPTSLWPHFHYTLYVSKDLKLDTRDDYEIIYRFVRHSLYNNNNNNNNKRSMFTMNVRKYTIYLPKGHQFKLETYVRFR